MLNKLLLMYVVTLLMPLLAMSASAESLILEEITVRGQEIEPKQETLTVREVRESAARDIGEALEMVPGFTSVRKGGDCQ